MRHKLSLALLIAACAGGFAAAAGDELSLAPYPGVLLLHNGEIVDGTITAAGDHYDVNKAGGVIFVKRSDVALAGRDTMECYRYKRSEIEQGRVLDHLTLAEWCLRHNLLQPAEDEISAARAADRDHPKIRLLAARLKLAQEEPAESEAAPAVKKPASLEQLDGVMRNLPPGSTESFTVTIQPMLLNHCTKAGCHGPQSTNTLRLERIHPNRSTGRLTTQRNLAAALALVDRENPAASKLLQAPVRAHGGRAEPAFGDRDQGQYRQLVQWVYLVAGAKEQVPRPSLEERGAPLLQNMPRNGGTTQPREQPGETTESGAASNRSPAQDWFENFPDQRRQNIPEVQPGGAMPAKARPGEKPVQNAVTVPARMPGSQAVDQAVAADGFVPKDPFDPAIFNRQFFGR